MAKQVEYACCCDGMEEAIEMGGIRIMEADEGPVAIITGADSDTGMVVNFCPFCGSQLVVFEESPNGTGQ